MCLDIVSTRKRSRLGLVSDTRGSRLGLVSDSSANVSVSSRSRELRSRSWSRSRPRRSWAHPLLEYINFFDSPMHNFDWFCQSSSSYNNGIRVKCEFPDEKRRVLNFFESLNTELIKVQICLSLNKSLLNKIAPLVWQGQHCEPTCNFQ